MEGLKDLYIIGAGGFGREVAWLVERINSHKSSWNLKGFIDDNKILHGSLENGYPVLGDCNYLLNFEKDTWIICAVGSAKIRKSIVEKFKSNRHLKFATLIDPNTIYSQYVSIGEGSIICAGTIITTNVSIGSHVIVNLGCTIGHDVTIQDFTTVYPGVNISGDVRIGTCTELGTGMQIIQGKQIGVKAIVGAGSVVIRNIPANCTAVGNPTRIVKAIS